MSLTYLETENPDGIFEVSTELDHVVVQMGNKEVELIMSLAGTLYIVERDLDSDVVEYCSDASLPGDVDNTDFIEEYSDGEGNGGEPDDFYDEWVDTNQQHAWQLECQSRLESIQEDIDKILDDSYTHSLDCQEQLMNQVFTMLKSINK